ncbi:MAG: hypothetical protein HOW59_00405 [Nonomuraea sp.]|nr:hypothetical protein [Nonomuraea sp.]
MIAPGGHFAGGDRRDAFVPEPGGDPGAQPLQMAAALRAHLGLAHPEIQVALDPHPKIVIGTEEVHSGRPSGAETTWMLPAWW